MYLKKFKENQLSKEKLKSIIAGFAPDCEPGFTIGCRSGYYSCDFSGFGSVCLPQGIRCIN